MKTKKLFLLDAFALIYRAYYAMIRSPRITSKGVNTSAIFGFCNTLDEVLRKENPTHIAVCFDPPGKTFRHEMYDEYKAGRDEQPEDITAALPYIKRIIRAYNIPVVEVAGYEADDVIGTLSRMAEEAGFDTYMMTPDKDYGQLVTDHVWMYRPSLRGEGFEIRGPKEVCERYGIEHTGQIIDLLALEGDAADNIPGCPGVGEKTARKFISIWGSVDNLLRHSDDIPGAMGKRIRENADRIRFSRELATIKTDVPLDVTPEMLVRRPENLSELIEIYKELEFRTFIRRLGDRVRQEPDPAQEGEMGSLFDQPGDAGAGEAAAAADTLASVPHCFRLISDPGEVAAAVSALSDSESVGVEFHAVGADAMTARLTGMAFAADDGSVAFYVSVPQGSGRAAVVQAVAPLFGPQAPALVGHDIKRICLLMAREGVEVDAPYFDTSVAHYLIEPEMNHKFENLAARYLGYQTIDYNDGPKVLRRLQDMPADDARDLFCEGAMIALRLREALMPMIVEREQLPLLDEIELPLVKVLAGMEFAGVRVNTEELKALSGSYTAQLRSMEDQVYEIVGRRFNIASPSQVGEILFGEMQIDPKAKRTKKGAFSTTEEILEKYRHTVPLVDLILKIRAVRKLLATYIDALPLMVNPATGKIHTTYNQTVTSTGRISSANPNLQNIPIRTDDGREIRRTFIADDGCLIMSADYSQIELRLIADISGDKDMIGAFVSGEDIHRATAAKIYQVASDQVTDSQRRNAKTANFGIIYGISAFGLSERLGIPRSEAKMLIDGYFASYPHIREYIEEAMEGARKRGYVSTIKGRRRYLPDINSRNSVVRSYAERNAVNAPIQGSAADIIKIAMVSIDRAIRAEGLRSSMIMQVHDELVFNVIPEELPRLQKLVTDLMESAYKGLVPLEVAAGVGANWLEAH